MNTLGSEGQGETNQTKREAAWLNHTCFRCGTVGLRDNARFCMACGRELEDPSYRPVAALRATYNLKRTSHSTIYQDDSNMRRPFSAKFSTPNRNGASSTAMAFVTYALVPYLGILFCPGAVLMGGIGLIRQWRLPHLGGRNASYAGVVCGVMIFSAQLILWWMLYKVPQWATGVEF